MRTLLALASLFAASPAFAQTPLLPDGPAKHTIETACATCHALSRVTGAGHTQADWEAVVNKMINAGAQVSPADVPAMVDYLAKNFPPKSLPVLPNP
jgi:hypothetical protein